MSTDALFAVGDIFGQALLEQYRPLLLYRRVCALTCCRVDYCNSLFAAYHSQRQHLQWLRDAATWLILEPSPRDVVTACVLHLMQCSGCSRHPVQTLLRCIMHSIIINIQSLMSIIQLPVQSRDGVRPTSNDFTLWRLRTKLENAFCHAGEHVMKSTYDHPQRWWKLTQKTF